MVFLWSRQAIQLHTGRAACPLARKPRPTKPALEALEDRNLLSFSYTNHYDVGLAPRAVAVGDFDGDGKLDLVVANSGDNNVSVLLGNGDGTFRAPVNYAVGSDPWSVVVKDFNNDGKLDIAVANHGSWTVSVLLGNGNGTFQAALTFGTDPRPSAIAVADFNNDGKWDLVTSNRVSISVGDATVSVLLGNGDGTFQAARNFGFGKNSIGVATGDFNNDNKQDVVQANTAPRGNVNVYLGDGTGSLGPPTEYEVADDVTGLNGFQPVSVAVGDFNQDGKLDIVSSNNGSDNLTLLFGNGDGTFPTPLPAPWPVPPHLAAGFSPNTVIVGDFNNDLLLDLAVANFGTPPLSNDSSVSVIISTGGGSFQATVNYHSDLAKGSTGLAVGDFNGDGFADLVVANNVSNNVSILLNVAPHSPLAGSDLKRDAASDVYPYGVFQAGPTGPSSSATLTTQSLPPTCRGAPLWRQRTSTVSFWLRRTRTKKTLNRPNCDTIPGG